MKKSKVVAVKPTGFRMSRAGLVSLVLLLISVAAAALTNTGDGFTPRVPAIDALAGLAAGAFLVDRLLTFVPARPASTQSPAARQVDIDSLRWGWGAFIGMLFVLVTGLRAVAALTDTTSPAINPRVDRVIAVLAIAGGVKGLALIKNALNPTSTAVKPDETPEIAATNQQISWSIYGGGFAMLVVAALLALCVGNSHGVELLGSGKLAGGTIGVVIRFGPLILASVIIQQLVEHSFASSIHGPGTPVLAAGISVILGVVAAWLMHMYLLHNLGFFHTGAGAGSLDRALAASSLKRHFDLFATGLVIASGTSPLHDLTAALTPSKP